jgi:hypothetical protein
MIRLANRIHALAISAALLALSHAAAQSACPSSEFSLSSAAVTTTSAASLDTSYFANRLQYDLVAGTLNLSYCCSLSPTYMIVRDSYDVTGVPPGTPVSLVVAVPVSGEIYDSGGCGGSGCSGHFLASIRRGAEYTRYTFDSPALFNGARISFSDVVQLPFTIVAGQPETLEFEFWARRSPGGSHGTIASGTIQFAGLSVGQSVISCQGYAGPTPVHRSSWGALKSHYR